ncbi:MAG: hypothetical protein ACRCZ0_11995 [Cetobacterium sp.]
MSKYYIRLKNESNEFVLGYEFSKTKRSLTEITRYGESLVKVTEEQSIEEWKLRCEIFYYATEFDWTQSNRLLKNWIVKQMKQHAKKYKLKVEVSRRS